MSQAFYAALIGVACATAAVAWIVWDIGAAASVLLGGALALINARWMAASVNLAVGNGEKSIPQVLTRFIGRLLLILVVLSAIIHTSFLSVLGVFAGLSAGAAAALADGFRQLVLRRR